MSLPILTSTRGLDLSLTASLSPLWTFTRASSGTLFAGNVKSTAATNIPRFETTGAGSPQGILLEPQSTNLVTYSNDLTNGLWAHGSVTPAFNAVGPDGLTSASTLTTSATGNISRAAFATTPGVVYTCSFLAKSGTMTALNYSVYDFVNLSYIVPTTAYYSQVNGTTYTRVQLTFTAPGGCTSAGICPIRDTLSIGTVFVTGVQAEAIGYATSTIDTSGTTATRAADNLTLALSQMPGLQTAAGYCVALDFSLLANAQATAVIFGMAGAGGFSDTWYLTLNGSGNVTATTIVATVGANSASYALRAVGLTNKIAVRVLPTGLKFSLNGAAEVTIANAGMPAMITAAVMRAPWGPSNYTGGRASLMTLVPGPGSTAWAQARST